MVIGAGMTAGAIIALFFFVIGYILGSKYDVVWDEESDKPEQEGVKAIPAYSDIDSVYQKREMERFEIEKRELEQRRKATDLFRSKKGLLSYKKFVRE